MSNQTIAPGLIELGLELYTNHPSGSMAYTLVTTTADSGLGIDAAPDVFRAGIWTLLNTSGTDLPLRPFRVDASGQWVSETLLETLSGQSPVIIGLSDGSFRLAYTDGGTAYTSRYRLGVGEANVQSIGTASLVDAIQDKDGRLICALYDGSWKVRVGALDAGGTTFTFSSAVSMGLTADEARGKLIQLKDRSFLFFFVSGGSATVARCRNLLSTGAGSWL
jgi:hypothetical protein